MKHLLHFVAAATMLCLTTALSAQSSTFTGRVFNDRNANGVLDAGEKGLANVAVTDGFTVVLTDHDGTFTLTPSPRTRFISVTTPDGWRHTNRFFTDVRDRMAGQVVSDTILNRTNTDLFFALAKTPAYGRFIHMSDVEDREYMDWIDRIKEYAAIHTIDFIVVTGDICYASGLPFFTRAMNDDNVGRRVVYTIGNHDLIKGSVDYLGNPYGEKLFEDCFGPSWYSYNAGGIHYIVTPMLHGDAKPSYSADDIRAWIQRDLSVLDPAMPIVMFNHDAAKQLIPDSANVKAFVYGHRHIDLHTVSHNGVAFYCCMSPSKGANDHAASAFREFTLTPTGVITTRLHYAPITNHVVAHALDHLVNAVIYDAASEPLSADVIMPSGKRVPMHQLNDMMWQAALPTPMPKDAVYKIAAVFSDGETIITPQHAEPTLRWMTTLPCKTFFTNPILAGDRLYIAGMDNENTQLCGIFCLDAASGRIIWSYTTANSIKGDMALVDGVLYAGDVDYHVYALNAADGSLRWTRRVSDSMYPTFTEGICVDNGLVYAGTASTLTALDAATGDVVWTNTHKHGSITNVSTNRVANGALLTNGYWVGRYCYDAATGAFLWEKKDYNNRYSSCTPAVVDTTFFYTGYGAVMQVAARTGEVIRSAELPFVFNTRSQPLVLNGKLFVGTSNNGFLAVDTASMTRVWNFLCEPALIYTSPYTKNREKTVESSPVAYGDKVIFGANDGFVYCLNQSNGRFAWRLKIGLPVISQPQVVDNLLYLTDFAGNIYCYQLPL